MRDIAARAGVSIATIYHHFPSKVHLLVAALDEELQDFADRIDGTMGSNLDPFARLRRLVDELLWGMQSSDRMTEAFTHAYAAGYAMAIPEADMVRDRTVDLFSMALGDATTPGIELQIAEVLADVWTCEIFGFVQERSSFADFRSRLMVTIDLLAKASGSSDSV